MKWLVGVVAGVYGKPNPLVIVLIGAQNTGKTEWFRRLLPEQLANYYGELNHDSYNKKDESLLFTEKLILLDDEFGNKSKKEVL